MQLVISDGEGNILVNQGDMLLEEEAIAQKLRSNTERAGLMYMISRKDLEGENLRILLVHKDEKLAFWNQMEFWLLFILIPLTAFAVLWNVYRFVKRIIYQPIDHFVHRLTEMKKESFLKISGKRERKTSWRKSG